MDAKLIVEQAAEAKEKGNQAFRSGNLREAVTYYRASLLHLKKTKSKNKQKSKVVHCFICRIIFISIFS